MTNNNITISSTEVRGYEHPVDFLRDGGVSFSERVRTFEPRAEQVELLKRYAESPEELDRIKRIMSRVAVDSALERNRLEMLSLESIGIHPDLRDERFCEYLNVAGRPEHILKHVGWFYDNVQNGHTEEIVRGHMVKVDYRSSNSEDNPEFSEYEFKGVSEEVKSPSSEIGSVIQFGDWTYCRDLDAAVDNMLREATAEGYQVQKKQKSIDPRRYRLSFVETEEGPQDILHLNRERAFADISLNGLIVHFIKRSETLVSVGHLPGNAEWQRRILGSKTLDLSKYATQIGPMFELETAAGGARGWGMMPVSTTYYMRIPTIQ